jgi:hypothetical protein
MILAATTDKFQLTTSAAVNIDVHVSYIDASSTTLTPSGGGKQNTAISTATTTDVLASPGASTLRTVTFASVRNKGTSPCTVTWVFDQNGTDYELFETTLQGGESLTFVQGIGWVKTPNGVQLRNWSTASQSPFSSDTYLSGSFIVFPQAPSVGTLYQLRFDVVKTGAGTATPIITVRTGTAGTTSDTSRLVFTFGAGTANADNASLRIEALFRTVGSGTSAVLQGRASAIKNLEATGWSTNVAARQVTSSGFDSTTAGLGIGASYNGGASASHTVQLVDAILVP